MRRTVVAGLIVFGLVSGLARAALFHRDGPLRGTNGPDLILGTPGPDTIAARGGDDRISTAWDDVRDTIDCGAGDDVVTADLLDVVSANCETVGRKLSNDTTSDLRAEHATQVEPSAFASGRTVVTAFQSGRIPNGGAAAIGFATSRDGATTWRSGLLPQGGFTTVSDPVVAFDAAHSTWLVAAIGAAPGVLDLYVARSHDGLTWGAPIVAASDVDEDYDKEWLACDNGARSPFRGNCYLAYVDIRTHWLAIRHTTDGGATWSAPARVQPGVSGSTFSGPMPVVRPNGDVVVAYVLFAPIDGEDRIADVTSHDGGATWSAPTRIAPLSYEESLFEIRAPVMPNVAADAAGKLYAVWSDDRFRNDGTSMDPVLATSSDGVHWSDPVRLPTLAGPNLAFIPAVAVDGPRVAVTYYTAQLPRGCALFHTGCAQETDAWLVASKDAGAHWSRPRQLNAEPMSLDWLAETTLGRMVGDYVAAVYVAGRPLAVVALAGPPTSAQAEAIFAVR